MHVVVGYEALDLVDGNRFVNVAAGTLSLTALVADSPADRWERVLRLDKLQRLGVSPLRGELEIALHRDMSGTRGLTRRGTARQDVLAVLAVVLVDGLGKVEGLGYLRIFRRGCVVRRAELLAELQRVAGTYLDALRAGHALGFVHLGNEVRADRVARAEHHTGAKSEAGAGAAVADSRRLAAALDVRDIVHEAVFLGTLYDFISLFAAYLTGAAGTDVVLRPLAHLDAHILGEMSAAVPQQRTRRAARTWRDREGVVFI